MTQMMHNSNFTNNRTQQWQSKWITIMFQMEMNKHKMYQQSAVRLFSHGKKVKQNFQKKKTNRK